jgi:hypothetical protein
MSVHRITILKGEKKVVDFEVDDEVAKSIVNQLVDLSFLTTDAPSKDTHTEYFKELPQLPTFNEIKDLIKSQPNYKHSVELLALHFAQRRVESSESNEASRWLNAIRSTTSRVRAEIEDKDGGDWSSERRDRQKIFTFIKREGETRKQLQLLDQVPVSHESE